MHEQFTYQMKSLTTDQRKIRGVASTSDVDREGEVLVAEGVKFTLPLPLLMHHDFQLTVGQVTSLRVVGKAIEFEAELPEIEEPGALKERVDEAWQSIKAGLIRGVSVGFLPHSSTPTATGRRVDRWELFELSLTPVPVNARAGITGFKALPDTHPQQAPEEKPMSIAKQIKSFTEKRSLLAASMKSLMDKAGEEGRTLTPEEEGEYDQANADLAAVDKHLVRLKSLETDQAAGAKAITPPAGAANPAQHGQDARDVSRVTSYSTVPKGRAFARYAKALAMANGNRFEAAEYAKAFHDTPQVALALKAAVQPGTTTGETYGAPLAPLQYMANEFIELLTPQTIIGRLPGLRTIPFNVSVPRHNSGSTVNWVGEAKPAPVSSQAFGNIQLGKAKVVALTAISQELVKLSTPQADAIIQDEMSKSIVKFLDTAFIDPTRAAVEGVSPASVTKQGQTVAASGTDAAALRADIKAVVSKLLEKNISPNGCVWVMTEIQALSIGMMRSALGGLEFPGIGATGGVLENFPVITSNSVPTDAVAGTSPIVLLKSSEILVADEGGIEIDITREASLLMSDDPENDAGTPVSLFQNGLVGIRALRDINWTPRRADAVASITGAKYA